MASTRNSGDRGRGGRQQSPAVYRRRRLALLILAVLVVAVLVAGGTALAGFLGRDGASGAPGTAEASGTAVDPARTAAPSPSSATPSTAPSAAPSTAAPSTAAPTTAAPSTAEPKPTPSGSCDEAKVVVRTETDRKSYGPGENPVLTLVVRNNGAAPCEVNVGTSQMRFEITAAGERVFSSTDCQDASRDLARTIAPGGEERATFAWSRNRTVPGCTGVDGKPAAGEYTVTTSLGARTSPPVAFTLR